MKTGAQFGDRHWTHLPHNLESIERMKLKKKGQHSSLATEYKVGQSSFPELKGKRITGQRRKVDLWLKQNQNHLCACGCGEKILVVRRHHWQGKPRYIKNHYGTSLQGKTFGFKSERDPASEAKRKQKTTESLRRKYAYIDEFIIEHTGKHLCSCGCGRVIKIRRVHCKNGIPRLIKGHSDKQLQAKSSATHKRNWQNPLYAKARVASWQTSPTSIELAVKETLDKLGVKYIEQESIPEGRTIADFYIPAQRLVIYADGIYWHSKPKAKDKDTNQNFLLGMNGYKVLRLPENEIRKGLQERKIIQCLNES